MLSLPCNRRPGFAAHHSVLRCARDTRSYDDLSHGSERFGQPELAPTLSFGIWLFPLSTTCLMISWMIGKLVPVWLKVNERYPFACGPAGRASSSPPDHQLPTKWFIG